jgi:hypothetical protein
MRTIFVCIAALALSACDRPTTSDQKQSQQQEQAVTEANAQTGFPGVTNFTEKKMVRMLYELRDKKVSTFTYVMDMNGRLFHVCDSIGYGLPYGVQFTNPERDIFYGTSSTVHHNMPQAEPNGLFMPPTAEGTWIMCAKSDGQIDPVYVEPRVVVSPHKLRSSGEWAE